MYQVLLYTEFIVSIVILVLSLILFRYKISRPIQYIQYAFFCMFLLNIGYWIEIQCTDLDAAMVAVKIEYCGSVYISTLMMFVVTEYLHVSLKPVIKWVMLSIDSLILLGVLTYEKHDLFFSAVGYEESGLYPHVVLESGILRHFFTYYTNFINLFMLLILTYYFIRKFRDRDRVPVLFLVDMYLPFFAVVFHFFGIMETVDLSPIFIGAAGVGVFAFLKNDMLFQIVDVATGKVIDNMQDAFIVMDSKMKLLELNNSAKLMFPELAGYDEKPVIVYECSEVLRKIINERPKDVILIGDRYYMAKFSSILNNNRLEGYYIHFSDRTEWKHYTDDLIQRSIDAENESEAKSNLLVNTSHDIRTPINAIIGMNELILRKTDDEEIIEHASDVERAGKYLLSLVNNILDISKIGAGKMHIIDVDYDMTSLLDEVIGLGKITANEKNLQFNINVDSEIPDKLHGDEVRIKQILNNIISNAVKYTEKGQVDMNVSLVEKDEFFAAIRFEIKDTGIGIKEEDMPKILESFERVDENRNYNVQGTGLGMPIITSLLEMMNSKLYIESVYTKGSNFHFVLKQGVAGSSVVGDYNKRNIKDNGKKRNYKCSFSAPDARVLVVDDNRLNMVVLNNLLKLSGINIDNVFSGEACIEAVKENTYHVILLDYMMPGMDGIETLKQLKTMEGNKSAGAYVIALTANVVSGVESMYKTAGFDDYLAKPIEYRKLETMLIKALPSELVIMNS
ncbi:MAG: response regulator [Lachnospiraceae bacterium]|nr:response regulator [Lachnospiraceae bacterium]